MALLATIKKQDAGEAEMPPISIPEGFRISQGGPDDDLDELDDSSDEEEGSDDEEEGDEDEEGGEDVNSDGVRVLSENDVIDFFKGQPGGGYMAEVERGVTGGLGGGGWVGKGKPSKGGLRRSGGGAKKGRR